jgi:hypothetical protein
MLSAPMSNCGFVAVPVEVELDTRTYFLNGLSLQGRYLSQNETAPPRLGGKCEVHARFMYRNKSPADTVEHF